MDSIERVEKMKEDEALPPIFKKIVGLRDAGHLDKEMCENMKVMLAGYFLYREGIETMGTRLAIREGAMGCYFPEAKK